MRHRIMGKEKSAIRKYSNSDHPDEEGEQYIKYVAIKAANEKKAMMKMIGPDVTSGFTGKLLNLTNPPLGI